MPNWWDLCRLVSFSLNHLSNLSILLSLVCFHTFVVRSPWLAFTVNPVTIAESSGAAKHILNFLVIRLKTIQSIGERSWNILFVYLRDTFTQEHLN